jgi:hypothetical protein
LGPSALELRFDFCELPFEEIRIVAGDLTEVVRAAYVIERPVDRPIRRCVEMGAIMPLVFVRQCSGRFGNSAAGPPTAERAGNAAEQRSDWTGGRSDSGSDEHAADATRGLA